MIEIRGLKLPVTSSMEEFERLICKKLHMKEVPQYRILKRSIDARKKPDIYYVYSVGVLVSNETKLLKKIHDNNIMLTERPLYQMPQSGMIPLKCRPIIVGAGPAGLFCGLQLAKLGYKPIIIEQGACVEERTKIVEGYFQGESLNTQCNVQFGEGGAGTFSDGKLNTQVKDRYGRIQYVLESFVKHGASEEILYDNKPHVGTDVLANVVKGLREEIKSYGGEFRFNTKVVDFDIVNHTIQGVRILQDQVESMISTHTVILAIGHSARDTFECLYNKNIVMEPKDFAMGVRVEHPASWIQNAMYGDGVAAKKLPAAPYKLTYQASNDRGVYSFCMCPGGYVVNASSEENGIAVNGMSYSNRAGENSNSAIVVTVRRTDFESEHPLAGMYLQRKLESNVCQEGNGQIVCQRFEDFRNRIPTTELGIIKPCIKGKYTLGNLANCLPDFMSDAIIEGVLAFEHKIKGFSHNDTVLSGVESRTSSPIRITRDEQFVSNIKGIYPCGEGAGYAGGIMSAAVDGLKVAEAIIKQYQPNHDEDNR